jgi:hypothetical protein
MDAENQSQFRVYYWLVRDGATGKVRKTRWRLSEKRAEALYPDAVRLEEDSILIQGEAPEIPVNERRNS